MGRPLISPISKEGYQLLHEGTLALAAAEQRGMRIDVGYCQTQSIHLGRKIERMEKKLLSESEVKEWKKIYRNKFNLNSDEQLADVLFNHLGYASTKKTASGKDSTDKTVLDGIDSPMVKSILELRGLQKAKNTYIDNILREQVNGILRPSFNLNTAKTIRSCVAKGSKVLVVRDFIESPEGVPIEEIKEGDYVYCFDDNLNPAIQKVLWAGKTGHRKVVRLHWSGKGGHGKGFLDVTPEHLVRLINGTYKQAQELDPKNHDYRRQGESLYLPRVSVLSCCRIRDSLLFTGHLKHGKGPLEHRLIYEHFNRKLKKGEVVHHKNGNHLDHSLSNLEATTLQEHSRHHCLTRPQEITNKCIQALHDNRHKIVYMRGEEHCNYIGLSKYQCLRYLAKAAGQLVKVSYDFETFKKCVKKWDINSWAVKRRYDRNGKYITQRALKEMQSPITVHQIVTKFGLNHKKAQLMLKERGVDFVPVGKCRNPYGRRGIPGNHTITKVEWLEESVDVYDIEVEECHNFFANEICVHNSSSLPNFQNIPIRDPYYGKMIRRAFIPRNGFLFGEGDYGGIEVKTAACYHNDPTMLTYIRDASKDMHRDMAMQCYMLSADEWDKITRYCAKNKFVFPEFYGSYFKQVTIDLWNAIDEMSLKTKQGIPLKQHLASKGITCFEEFENHIEAVEEDFWGTRFKVYAQWKKDHYLSYQKNGYVDSLTGFRYSGYMKRNEVINYPVQGAAFHCLLKSLIEVTRIAKKEKWKSGPIGQIHDSMVNEIHKDEYNHVLDTIHWVMCEWVPKQWPWIIVPLEVEIEMADIGKSWYEKGVIQKCKPCRICKSDWMKWKNYENSSQGYWKCPVCGETSDVPF